MHPRALAGLLSIIVFASCSPVLSHRSVLIGPERIQNVDVPERVVRTREERASDEKPEAYAMNRFDVDFSAFKESNWPGIKVGPGDVLRIHRFWPTTKKPTDFWSHQTGPQSFSARIPLRLVDEQTGFLHGHEKEFLATVLAVNRSNEYRQTDDANRARLSARLEEREIDLWNSLVDSLAVKRAFRSSADEREKRVLVLTVDLNRLIGNDDQLQPFFRSGQVEFLAVDAPSTSVWDAVAGLGSAKGNQQGGYWPDTHAATGPRAFATKWAPRMMRADNTSPSVDEIERIVAAFDITPATVDTLVTAFEATYTIDQGGDMRADLLKLPGRRPPEFATFSFVSVELRGVDVNRPQWPESEWTLAEWEKSGVCRTTDGKPAEIGAIRLRGNRNWFVILHPGLASETDDKEMPDIARPDEPRFRTHHVDVVRTATGIERRLVRKCTACSLVDTLDQYALEHLYIEDLSGIQWDLPVHAGESTSIISSPNVTFR